MRQILKMTAAALALVAALPAGPADAKFVGRMNIGGRIDPAAATPAPSTPAPAPLVTFAFEGGPAGCAPFSESSGGLDLTVSPAPGVCFNQTPLFSGQASFSGLALRTDWTGDVLVSFPSQVTLVALGLGKSGPPQSVTLVSSTGASHTVAVGGGGGAVEVTLPPDFAGTYFTIVNPAIDALVIDTVVVQP